MWRRYLTIAVMLSIGLAVFPGDIRADCNQKDLEGTWSVQIFREDLRWADNRWDQCTLTIGPDGAVKEAGVYTDWSKKAVKIAGGYLTFCPGRIIQGAIVTSRGAVKITRGAITGKSDLVLVIGDMTNDREFNHTSR